jgi:hypothetical protein
VVLAFGAVVAWRERHEPRPLRAGYFLGMLGEALCWAPLFALMAMYLTVQATPTAAAEPQLALAPLAAADTAAAPAATGAMSPLAKIGLSLGAGVYEEFVFRVLLVGGLAWLARLLFPRAGWGFYPVVGVAGDKLKAGQDIPKNHKVALVAEVLGVRTDDVDIWYHAIRTDAIVVTCNRQDFLELTGSEPATGLIILNRRRTRQAECSHLLRLVANAGATGLKGNINFA